MIGTANLLYTLGVNIITSYYDWREREDIYPLYCEYIAQIGANLRGGNHICDIGVLYPIRSIWSNYLPTDKPFNESEIPVILKDINIDFINLCRLLLTNQLDFDIIDEEGILDSIISNGNLRIANEEYKIIICPPIDTIKSDTLIKLLEFSKNGGIVIFTEMTPVRGVSENDTEKVHSLIKEMINNFQNIVFVKDLKSLPYCLEKVFCPEIKLVSPNKNILYTHKKKGLSDIYFIINNSPEKIDINIKFRNISNMVEVIHPLTEERSSLDINHLEFSLNGYEGVFFVSSE